MCLLLPGKDQDECLTLPFDGPYADVSTVGGRDVLDDGQAEAGAHGGAVPGWINPIAPLEDPVDLLGSAADALAGHRDLDGVLTSPGGRRAPGELDRASCGERRGRDGW